MTMTTLDEIAARADVIDRCLRANPNDCYDRGDLDEAVIAALEDVPVLVAAFKAVEAVEAPTGDDYTFDLGYAAALDKVRNTIREALGS